MDTCSRENSGKNYTFILNNQLTIETLNAYCIKGELRTSNLRSIVWRILLKCLPISKIEWVNVINRARNAYEMLKRKNIPNPHDECFCQDPQINNPLDQGDHNPWQRYFADYDLRDLISKDVSRTYPELEFFQQDHIRRMMCDILLIYAKENPFVSYKQGMHEILAPLVFVLFSDQQSFSHCKENGNLNSLSTDDYSILSHVYNAEYLENDSYAMFSEMMLEVVKWYEEGSQTPKSSDEAALYSQIQDAAPTSQIMRDLTAIGQKLHEVDAVLSNHLRDLDIPPQLYGIRWLRLLFGREFAIHDLLYIWDVILSERPVSEMVECMFVAMLIQIRDLLLESDYSGSLQYLMRYPPIVDVSAFIQEVLHIRNPKANILLKYSSSSGISSLRNFTHLTITGTHHPNRSRHETTLPIKAIPSDAVSGFRNITSSVLSKVKNTLERPPSTIDTPPVTTKNVMESASGPPTWEKEILLMEEQVACLQIKLNEKDIVCSEAAVGIDWCVEQLRGYDEHKISEVRTKLMGIRKSITAEQPNRRPCLNIPQPRQIHRENEMVSIGVCSAK
ncbi:hypothetical protein DICVIV_10774 [Dictyocaulus viviparus]|uniref:Rab-GAP TBC domain-containing protein n=1 Tax=Dictyocaulus viviparus TaxID=29172 RepID=A0A0D8XHJ9_DICVI|nr:hypothetical protein DICVIV_10774 [Dictyocaulus viviparus]